MGEDPAIDYRPRRSELARRLVEFSESHREYSPLYSALSARAAEDRELLALLGDARPGQRRPVLLFAAVQFLLLGGADHELRDLYPTLRTAPAEPDPGRLWSAFRDFCRSRRDELVEIVSSRNTQTNEVRRCAGFLPAVRLAGRLAGGPLALIEVGCSAGLNLRMERYSYRYSTGDTTGEPDSPLRLDCQLTGRYAPDVGSGSPIVVRTGVDLAPVDVTDDDAVRWLAACVYADQPDRVARLNAAVRIARADPVPLVAGNALDALPELLANLPEGVTPCLFHSWAVTYFPRDDRARLVAMLGELAARRPLVWIASEPAGTLPGLGARERDVQSGSSLLALATLTGPTGPQPRWRMLGRMQSHGAWLSWSDADSARPLR